MYVELKIYDPMRLPYVGIGEYLLNRHTILGEDIWPEGVEISFGSNPARWRVKTEVILSCEKMVVQKNGKTVTLRMVPISKLERIDKACEKNRAACEKSDTP